MRMVSSCLRDWHQDATASTPRRPDMPALWPVECHDVGRIAGQSLTGVEIALKRGGAITGTIVDANGEPVADVMVSAVLRRTCRSGSSVHDGRRAVASQRHWRIPNRGPARRRIPRDGDTGTPNTVRANANRRWRSVGADLLLRNDRTRCGAVNRRHWRPDGQRHPVLDDLGAGAPGVWRSRRRYRRSGCRRDGHPHRKSAKRRSDDASESADQPGRHVPNRRGHLWHLQSDGA